MVHIYSTNDILFHCNLIIMSVTHYQYKFHAIKNKHMDTLFNYLTRLHLSLQAEANWSGVEEGLGVEGSLKGYGQDVS